MDRGNERWGGAVSTLATARVAVILAAIGGMGTIALPMAAHASTNPYKQGIIAFTEIQRDFEIKRLTDVLAKNPDDADAYLKRAECWLAKRQYPEAIGDYQAFLLKRPNPGAEQAKAAYTGLGTAHLSLRDYPNAITSYDKVLAAAPSDPVALYGRAVAKFNAKDNDGAITDLKTYIATGKASQEAYMLLGNANVAKRDFPEAINVYSRFIETGPTSTMFREQAYVFRAICYLERAKTTTPPASAIDLIDKAIADLDQASAIVPADSVPKYCRRQAEAMRENLSASPAVTP